MSERKRPPIVRDVRPILRDDGERLTVGAQVDTAAGPVGLAVQLSGSKRTVATEAASLALGLLDLVLPPASKK